MNVLWDFFKKLPTSVKFKFIIAFIPSLILHGIHALGEVADKLNNTMISWIYKEVITMDMKYKNDTHYAGNIQPIKLMEAQMTPEAFCGYLRGNIIKYCSRYGKKKGADTEDEARKIQQYAKWLHEASKGDKITV